MGREFSYLLRPKLGPLARDADVELSANILY